MSLNPGNWWYYFNRINKSTAKCKDPECNYVKDTGKSYSTQCLKSHLENKHLIGSNNDNPLKRSFAKAQLLETDPKKPNLESTDILDVLHVTKSSLFF
uniref:BED-type domain-containing protein n=1 Tax=Meloidogyne hapla TaxID=6305 RepID=A0A1I8B7T8_MELHA